MERSTKQILENIDELKNRIAALEEFKDAVECSTALRIHTLLPDEDQATSLFGAIFEKGYTIKEQAFRNHVLEYVKDCITKHLAALCNQGKKLSVEQETESK